MARIWYVFFDGVKLLFMEVSCDIFSTSHQKVPSTNLKLSES